MAGLLWKIHVGQRLLRPQRRIRLRGGRDDDAGAHAVRQRAVAREHHEAGGQLEGLRSADAVAGRQINTSPSNYSPVRQLNSPASTARVGSCLATHSAVSGPIREPADEGVPVEAIKGGKMKSEHDVGVSRHRGRRRGASGDAARAGAAERAGRHRYGDQDRPDHALQRPGLGLWRDRPAPRPPISR